MRTETFFFSLLRRTHFNRKTFYSIFTFNRRIRENSSEGSKRIIAATQGHPGARNDKTTVKFDGLVTDIIQKRLYSEVPSDLRTLSGLVIHEKGLYLIVDRGYYK